MKLDAGQRKATMTKPHQLGRMVLVVRPGTRFEIVTDCILGHDQAVVAGGFEGVGESGKESVNSFEVMFGAIVRNTQETLGGERILDKLRGG